ncbi:hypothetical protein K2P47_01440 [Patescibacteria group bacterium]|nr:hypothetical protein [Patescibacteria group bacterium]
MITSQHIQAAQTKLGLDTLSPSDAEAILNRFGYDIVVATMTEFMTSLGEWEQNSFESWIEAHQAEPDMLEQLMLLYPQFGKILTEEILKLKNAHEVV